MVSSHRNEALHNILDNRCLRKWEKARYVHS